jgi:acetolactate synthase I/II/III large subunit
MTGTSMSSSKSERSGGAGNRRSGGQILVDALRVQGVDAVFCVPGESYLAALDAFHDAGDTIALYTCRQEGGAAFMADAYGRLTGRPGICFVTRGPGACNASVGIHMAYQASTPVVLFVGQVARGDLDREGFQEMDYRRVFGQMAKWVVEVQDAARLPELVSRAFHVAVSGRPGPVVMVLPEDMLASRSDASEVPRYQQPHAAPAPRDMRRLHELLSQARRPVVIAGGGGGWSADTNAKIELFAERNGLPVATAFRCQDHFDNTHPSYIGDLGLGMNPNLRALVQQADLIIAVGTRFDEITTDGFPLFSPPLMKPALVHVNSSPCELGAIYHPEVAIVATMDTFADAAVEMPAVDGARWRGLTTEAHGEYEVFSTPGSVRGDVDMGSVMRHLCDTLPEDAILTHGAGNFTAWPRRFYRYRRYGTQLGPMGGSMGYGVPSGVAAKVVHPQRTVVSFSGDGCFQMNGQEVSTAVQYGLAPIFVVINNGMLGTIRMHQERDYPGRISGTALHSPDFATLAHGYGANGEAIRDTGAFAPAFERARASASASILDILIDPEVITPNSTLSEIRRKALASS